MISRLLENLPADFVGFLRAVDGGASGDEAARRALGADPRSLDRSWRDWVRFSY